MHFCSMLGGQYTRQEFGLHRNTHCRMFLLPQSSHGSKERATSGNRFGWPSPKSLLSAESWSSAPAKGAAYAANVLKKIWSACHCANVTAQRANLELLRARSICEDFSNVYQHSYYDQICFTKRRSQLTLIFSAFLLQFLCPVLSAERKLGTSAVIWLWWCFIKCNLYHNSKYTKKW